MSRNMVRNVSKNVVSYAVPVLLLLLSSCYPEFDAPLSPPCELRRDHRISGTWVRVTESGIKEQMYIFPRATGWTDIVYIYDINSPASTDGINIIVLEGYCTFVDDKSFLNVRFRKKDRPEADIPWDQSPFFIANYELQGDKTLVIRPFSAEAVGEMVAAGKLSGEIQKGHVLKGQPCDRVIVKTSSEALMNLLQTEGVGAFVGEERYSPMILTREQK